MFFYCPSAQCPFWTHSSDLERPIITLETLLCTPCCHLQSSVETITQKKVFVKKVLSCFNHCELGFYTVICSTL